LIPEGVEGDDAMAAAIKKVDKKNEDEVAAFVEMFEWELFPNLVESEDVVGPNPQES
jgi:hypothetical protein